jgi:hypothetical protein
MTKTKKYRYKKEAVLNYIQEEKPIAENKIY